MPKRSEPLPRGDGSLWSAFCDLDLYFKVIMVLAVFSPLAFFVFAYMKVNL